jgi:tRNA pseudouridine55 synthase
LSAPFGFLNAFKPPGPSSAAFGNWVKRLAGGVAVGHWGTLDPMACGVLLLGVGKATRLLPLIADSTKSYVFELVAGEQTESGDAAGAVVATAPVPEGWRERLATAAAALVGTHLQVPPMHSAVKVMGTPLYRSARAGATVPRSARPVTIHELRVLLGANEPRRARMFVRCDAGTYVRVLCEDLGKQVGVPARMGALLRVAAGPFQLRDSVAPAQIARSLEGSLVDPLRVLTQPRYDVDRVRAMRFCAGNEIALDSARTNAAARSAGVSGDVLVAHEGALLGTAVVIARDTNAVLAPTRVLARPGQGA